LINALFIEKLEVIYISYGGQYLHEITDLFSKFVFTEQYAHTYIKIGYSSKDNQIRKDRHTIPRSRGGGFGVQ
jgi:hypothetical protein